MDFFAQNANVALFIIFVMYGLPAIFRFLLKPLVMWVEASDKTKDKILAPIKKFQKIIKKFQKIVNTILPYLIIIVIILFYLI